MKVLVLTDGEFITKEITNSLEDLQTIVGGYIEIPFLSQEFLAHEIDIIINEEGKYIDQHIQSEMDAGGSIGNAGGCKGGSTFIYLE